MSWSDGLVDWVQTTRVGSHLIRAAQRYFNRLGNQLAGSIAFISMMALVPVLMFVFSAVGLLFTVIRPDLLGVIQIMIVDNLNAGPLQDDLLALMSRYLYNWRNLGLLALATALFIGSGWVANLKGVLRGMMRPDFDLVQRRHNPLLEPIINVVILLALMLLIAVTSAATVIGTQLADQIVELLQLADLTISHAFVRLVSFALSLAGATLLFWLIFRYLPEEPSPRQAVRGGSIGAAVILVAMQTGTTLLTSFFVRGSAFQVFGPTILAMVFINIFGRLILFVAAWIATWNQPAIPRRYSLADEILRERENTLTAAQHWEAAEADRASRAAAKKVARPDDESTGRPVRIGTGATQAHRSGRAPR
ncbi:MAG: hypothetical protein GX454_13300 [Brooklawnia sp.]|nr:hypothetical protein [Brooklawnia sp.]